MNLQPTVDIANDVKKADLTLIVFFSVLIGLFALCVNRIYCTEFVWKEEDCLLIIESGTHPGVERLIQRKLNDPDSYEPIRGQAVKIEDGVYSYAIEFTARNEYGGRQRHVAGGTVYIEDCRATLREIRVGYLD